MLLLSDFCRDGRHQRGESVAVDVGVDFALAPGRPTTSARVSLEALMGLLLRDGDYARIEAHRGGGNDNDSDSESSLHGAVVRLELMDEDEEETWALSLADEHQSRGSNGSGSDRHHFCYKRPRRQKDSPPSLCVVSPVVLANLGVSPLAIATEASGNDSDNDSDKAGDAVSFRLVAFGGAARVAGRVLLRPLGRRPEWPYFPLAPARPVHAGSSHQDHGDGDGDNASAGESDSEGSSTSNDDDAWIFPSRDGMPLEESTLCGVAVPPPSHHREDENGGESGRPSGDALLHCYEVLRIEGDGGGSIVDGGGGGSVVDGGGDGERGGGFCITGPETEFELDGEPIAFLSFVRRLPQVLPPFARSGDEPTAVGAGGPPHPDWRRVAEALFHAPLLGDVDAAAMANAGCGVEAAASEGAARVLHLVGTDREHGLRSCVEQASERIGMRCLSVRGLAAFGYERRRRKGRRSPKRSEAPVSVGSATIEQQLAGIESAFDCILSRRMEPCLLHFCDVDEELAASASTGDESLRCQTEDRFWSKWMEGLARAPWNARPGNGPWHGRAPSPPGGEGIADGVDYRYTPRVLVVVSTTAPLKKGPWMERLVFPSISLSHPDESYIRYLWDHPASSSVRNIGRNEQAGRFADEMMPLLRGRPVREIVRLRQAVLSELAKDSARGSSGGGSDGESNSESDGDGESNSESDGDGHGDDETTGHLRRLCNEFDAGRRKKSSDVSLISNVSWQDVGGLDHVRAEIMDAIELPLKHPRLFPRNTGRSGILLFGPPGTGKTLVAKAVANECGLPFLSVKGPELLGSYVGESEANIRRVFASARLAASNNLPIAASILFFDEMDSLAPRRGETDHGGGVMERVVASLLAELDGGSSGSPPQNGRVFVLGATNRPDLLDPSLLRPGRLDRLVYMGIPTDHGERTRVLASQLRKMKLEADPMDLAGSVVERLPPRLTGADMSKLSSGAMLHAIRRLCLEADRARDERGGGVTIDRILEEWGEEKCTPVVTLDDLLLASAEVSPSVSEEELKRYERLRMEHCSSPRAT